MTNALSISITAADRATRVIQNINKRVAEMTRPFQNVQRSIERFSRAAGFDTVKRKLEAIGHSARGIAATFARIGAPLLALVGGGTIAGLIALTDGWARFGLKLTQTSQILGINTQQLYDFQNAARLVGLSGDAATQTFASFADTLQDARWGRNQQAMGLLLGLGIQLKTTRSGAIDAMGALAAVADRVQKFQKQGNTGAARTLARQLGITELLPLLMQGRKGIEAYEAQSRQLAGKMDWTTAAEAAMQWNRLDVAMSGTKNTISAALLPVLTPLIEEFGGWISANRQLIATDIGDFIKGLGAAFRGITLKEVLDDILAVIRGLLALGRGIAHVTGKLGGVKIILETLAVMWGTSKIIKYGAAFVKLGMGISGARKAFLAWHAASAVAGEGGAAAEGAAAAGAGAGGAAAAGGFLGLPSLAALLGATGIGLAGGAAIWGGMELWKHHELAKLNQNRIVAAPMGPSIMNFFQRQGWTAAQAAGITANLQAESNFDPNRVGDDGQARGIGQWHPERQAAFNAWAAQRKLPDLMHADLLEQLQYYDYELRHSNAGTRLAGARDAFDAGSIVSLYDERPKNALEEAGRRGALASQIAAPAPAPAPVNVSVRTTVHKDGTTTTRVQTPAAVKIVHTSPVNSVS
ncbi:MAG: hypothetical protein KGL39_15305 [Patescibacteria group bacterium]|nr:hypothetical protein [Patescibacteria group bacterium]